MALFVTLAVIVVIGLTFYVMAFRMKTGSLERAAAFAQVALACALAAFTAQQFDDAQREILVERTNAFTDLRDAMWKMMDEFPTVDIGEARALLAANKEVPKPFLLLTREHQSVWCTKMQGYFDATARNRYLVENRDALGHWRNAQAGFRSLRVSIEKGQHDAVGERIIEAQYSGIRDDFFWVWTHVILDAKEQVSPIGGRPR